jgi:rhodanese-related sulfurtransferase
MNEKAVQYFEEKLKYEAEMGFVKGLVEQPDQQFIIVDVRSREAYAQGHIPSALNIPRHTLSHRLSKLPKNKTIVLYCYHAYCFAGAKAALLLAQEGYSVMEMPGGFDEWNKRGFPVVFEE